MNTVTTIKFNKATFDGIAHYEVKFKANDTVEWDGEVITFAELEASLMARYSDDSRGEVHKTIGMLIKKGDIIVK